MSTSDGGVAAEKRWHCSGFVHPVSMTHFLDPLSFSQQVNLGRRAAAHPVQPGTAPVDGGTAESPPASGPASGSASSASASASASGSATASAHPHLPRGVSVTGRWSAAVGSEPVMLETNGCYLNVYTVANVEHGGNPSLVASVNVNDCGSIALFDPQLWDLPAHLTEDEEFQQMSPFCFVVEALQGHRELMAFKAPRVEDAEEWVGVLQGLRGTSFFEAKDKQRTGLPRPQEGTVGAEAATGSTRAADAASTTEATPAANAPPSAQPHVQAHSDAVPVADAEHGSRVGMLLVASPSRTVLSVPAELASVESDAVVVAEVAASAETEQYSEEQFRGADRYRGADIEGWGLDDEASLGIDGRTPSDSVYSVESIDDSDIPKCSFMLDPEHDDQAIEELEQEPREGMGPGPGPIIEQSSEEEEAEEWEEVQGLNDEQHSRSGAWGQLPPGLGPAPRGWKSSWRTLFMP